jgi:C1A family cysteine protease
MNSCWAFSYTGALESALIRRTGIEYDFSENNVQNSILKYAKYGIQRHQEGGDDLSALPYVVSWLGMLNYYDDEYDEVGKISPIIISPDNIHVQDSVIVPPRANSTDNNAIKEAILKYGSLSVTYYSTTKEPYYNKNTSAQYYDGNKTTNHMVSVVGWDDTYSASNFIKTPPKDGAWIIKNSYGLDFGEDGYNYISYYDTSFATTTESVGFILNNNEKYNKNYQTDLSGKIEFYQSKQTGKNSSYKNVYTAIEDDLISAVGTYFYNKGEAYTLEIYVNNQLELTQSGFGPYYGYHTIKLDKTIAIEKGDEFSVVMTKQYVPVIEKSRQHYMENTSFVNFGNGGYDLIKDDSTASLKVYTIEETILTKDLVKIYKNDSKFVAKIASANQPVNFTINGGTYTRISDANGIASLSVNLGPGNYTIETAFNGTSVKNNIEVLSTLIAENLVKYYRNESQFYIKLIDGQGNPVSGVNITMNINGVFYNRATNENGIARLNINLIPGEYILTALDPLTGLKMSYNITVLPTLTGEDLKMKYLDGSKYEAKLVDGQGKPIVGKNITFNINGVFYQRPTDENGIARLNIRLMAGEYIITSQYGQAKISNKITIST